VIFKLFVEIVESVITKTSSFLLEFLSLGVPTGYEELRCGAYNERHDFKDQGDKDD